jgi:effector-binding domain-containing protein
MQARVSTPNRGDGADRLIMRLIGIAFAALVVAAAPVLAQSTSPTRPLLDSPSPLRPDDAFGEQVMLQERTIIFFRGRGGWDTAFETLLDAFSSLKEYTDKQGIKPVGNPMTIYIQTNDAGFSFLAALPIAEEPKDPPKGDIAIGKTPSGRALKFTHRGSYESMDTTYEAITNYLDDKQLEAKDTFIEEYVGGPLKAGDNQLVVEVFVPLK